MHPLRHAATNDGHGTRWRRRVPAWLVPLALALASALVAAVAHLQVIDDAYISFRYAHQLAAGHGLVFNPGERVEGYTNLSWVLLMAVPTALGLPVATCAVVAGATFGLLAVIESWRICLRLGVPPRAAYAAALVPCLFPSFWGTMLNGLEGGLFAFLLMHTIRLVITRRSAVLAGLCGGLLFLTRPEGLVLAPLCVAYCIAQSRREAQATARAYYAGLVLPWLAVVIGATGWRLLYYGSWVPNTVLAKHAPWASISSAPPSRMRSASASPPPSSPSGRSARSCWRLGSRSSGSAPPCWASRGSSCSLTGAIGCPTIASCPSTVR